jgi:hypothetical protein
MKQSLLQAKILRCARNKLLLSEGLSTSGPVLLRYFLPFILSVAA